LSIDLTEVLWDKEGLLILITIFVGLLAAFLPAMKAYRLNLSKTLADA
jgi:putative ABC transport system permease protein